MTKKKTRSRFLPITPAVKEQLEKYIDAHYDSDAACARALGIHRNALSKILNGFSKSVSHRTANKIRKVCKISL